MSEETTASDDPLVAARMAKHRDVLRAGGYPYRFERTDLAAALAERYADLAPAAETGDVVTVAGRLMNVREMGALAFGVLQDGSGRIQLFVSNDVLGDDDFRGFLDLDSGDWIGASGEVITTKKGELSVRVESYTLLTKSLRPLPEKWHGLKDVEARSRRRYVDLMVNQHARETALTRVAVVSELRRQFELRGFVEVETPILSPQATGAIARPFITHHNALDLELRLRIATELYLKRLVVGGMERVYELGKIFRNEGVDSTHNPEFTMLEAYQALADYEDMMELIEVVFAAVAEASVGSTSITYQGRELSLEPPYRRARLTDLVSEAVGEEVSTATPIERLRTVAEGVPVCLTVALLDGLVLARSGFHTSINYRSVMAFGTASVVADEADKLAALVAFSERLTPGRWAGLREATAQELKATTVVSMVIDEASAKIRTGPPIDEDDDYPLDIWAGVLPVTTEIGEAIPDPKLTPGIEAPGHLRAFRIG